MQGNSFGQSMLSGLKTGGISALSAGVMGGIQGGIEAKVHGGDFWTGAGITSDAVAVTPSTSSSIEVGDGLKYSTEDAKQFSNQNFFFFFLSLGNFYADGSVARGRYAVGDHVYRNSDNTEIWGSAVYRGFGKTDVYLYKGAFTSHERLWLTMGHEYLHAGYNTISGFEDKKDLHHAAITKWQYDVARLWNFDVNGYYDAYKPFLNFSTRSVLNPSNFGIPTSNIKPWLYW
jgi:hypothetical protein